MPLPGNQIFPEKIWEIPGTEHWGTSSSRSRLSTDIRDLLFPGLVKGRETFGNSRTLPELKVILIDHSAIYNELVPKNVILTVPNKKNIGWYCLLRFSRKSLEIRYCSGISRTVLSSPVSSRLFPGFFRNFLE